MARCDYCGEHESLPYNCRYCGGQFCSTHRLPENHDCSGLDRIGRDQGIFDSGFDTQLGQDKDEGILEKIGVDTSRGGPLAYFRGNITYVFLLLMWITLILQWIALTIGGEELHNQLFVLSAEHPEQVWTWVTSIFAHSPFQIFHIIFNSIVIFFFGPLVERIVGSRRFAILFIISGIIAGLSQIAFDVFEGVPAETAGVLGASGAALAILGVLTIFNPNLRVYLFGIMPMSIWILTGAIAVISLALVAIGEPSLGGIAHMAHLAGLLVGLAYGAYESRRIKRRPPSQFHLGGRPPPGRRRY